MAAHLIMVSSGNRLGLISPDGTEERYLQFNVSGQVGWGAGPAFSDGRRIILSSYEQGKVWEGNVKSHLWIYDLFSEELTEIATQNPPAPFMPCSGLLPGDQRMITGPIIDGQQCIYTMNLDGSDQVALTRPGDGFYYGLDLSPDGTRLCAHVTRPSPYRIQTMGLDGGNRTVVAHHPDHLCFGPLWSPDGRWLLFQDCHYKVDPGHDWADLCIARPDGSDLRVVTGDQRHWFGAAHGTPAHHNSGSNCSRWSPDGSVVLYTRALPGSQTAWVWNDRRPDTDHFNRDYKPRKARGGTELCLLDPFAGEITQLTANDPPLWEMYASFSPDGQQILFSRAATGTLAGLWVMNADGSDQRLLTCGYDDLGARGRWLKIQA
jgi:TolB protein